MYGRRSDLYGAITVGAFATGLSTLAAYSTWTFWMSHLAPLIAFLAVGATMTVRLRTATSPRWIQTYPHRWRRTVWILVITSAILSSLMAPVMFSMAPLVWVGLGSAILAGVVADWTAAMVAAACVVTTVLVVPSWPHLVLEAGRVAGVTMLGLAAVLAAMAVDQALRSQHAPPGAL